MKQSEHTDPLLPGRKEQHVNLAVSADVGFRKKTTGFEHFSFEYNALPEIDFADVSTATTFCGKHLCMPLLVTGMTGGYPNAEKINSEISIACAEYGIAMGLGSMRAIIENPALESTFSVVRNVANTIPIIANIGAPQIAFWNKQGVLLQHAQYLVDVVGASMLAVHLNPLQELLQPEGQPQFNGVLEAIEYLCTAHANRQLSVPVMVKEVGAGITASVAQKLIAVGVSIIDVAGAGGTSWAGIEILRSNQPESNLHLWDVGTPTAECIEAVRNIPQILIASGGISSGTDAAKALVLGADIVGVARPIIQAQQLGGISAILKLFSVWELHIKQWMFLTGSSTLQQFKQQQLIKT